MRKISPFVALFIVFAFTALVYAATAPAVRGVNVPLTVPKVGKTTCKSMTTGKVGVAAFDVSGTTMVNWKAVTSATDTTAVTVKRLIGATTITTNPVAAAGMPATGETNLPIASGTKSLAFGKYSASSNAITPYICVDMN